MLDERWARLGDIVVSYSTRTMPGDRVLITMPEREVFSLRA